MGQGTDSCGGYDVEYDAYEEGLDSGLWTQRDGRSIPLSQMTVQHMKAAQRLCRNMALAATFTCEEDKWNAWVDAFENEIDTRSEPPKVAVKAVKAAPVRGTTVRMICHCNAEYDARQADLKRGWGLSCSKRCSAIRREFGRPAAKRKG
jgi:hypothetical protein